MSALDAAFLEDARLQFKKLKRLAEQAMEQVSDERFFAALDGETTSIALGVKHLAGNLRSRWTDFLASDGVKPGRDRDRELVLGETDTRAALMADWELGFTVLFATLATLAPGDVERQVMVRGEPHLVLEA